MSFDYEPMTEEEIQAQKLVPEDIYPFETISANPKLSKSSGNAMIELIHRIWDKDNREHHIYDYLVAHKSMMFKTKHYCDSTGLEKEYQDKKFNADICIGKKGFVHIVIKEKEYGGEGKVYPEKNTVKDYITLEDAQKHKSYTAKTATIPKDTFLNEEVPF